VFTEVRYVLTIARGRATLKTPVATATYLVGDSDDNREETGGEAQGVLL